MVVVNVVQIVTAAAVAKEAAAVAFMPVVVSIPAPVTLEKSVAAKPASATGMDARLVRNANTRTSLRCSPFRRQEEQQR